MGNISNFYPGLSESVSVKDAPAIEIPVAADIVDPFGDTPVVNIGNIGGVINADVDNDPDGGVFTMVGGNLYITDADLASKTRIGDTVIVDVDGTATEYVVANINTTTGEVIFDGGGEAVDAIHDGTTIGISVKAELSTFSGDITQVDGDVIVDVENALFKGTADFSDKILITDNDATLTGQKIVQYMHIDDYEDVAFTPLDTTLYLLHDS